MAINIFGSYLVIFFICRFNRFNRLENAYRIEEGEMKDVVGRTRIDEIYDH